MATHCPPPPRRTTPFFRCTGGRGRVSRLLAVTLATGCASSQGAAPGAPRSAELAPTSAPEEARREPLAASLAPQGRPVPPSPSGGCGRPPRSGGALTIRAGSLEAPYLLTLPEGYDGSAPVPLVFAFHGRTRSHQSMFESDAGQLALELGGRYAVAYVKSVGPGYDQPKEQRDNLQIFDALYAQLLGSHCIDTEQVFALGHSSGGVFSELLACERAPLLRGIAAVAGAMVWPECAGRSAALLVHGERDSVVSVSRGRAARDRLLIANGCSEQSAPVGAAGCVRYAGCASHLPVEWCEHAEPTYQDTNHGWPSFASAEIARFFGALARLPHAAGAPLLTNESFEAGSEPWQISFSGAAKGTWRLDGGALCATLDSAGDNAWDAQLQHGGLRAEQGRSYVIDYRLWTSAPSDVRVRLGLEAPPFSEYWQQSVTTSPEPRREIEEVTLAEPIPGPLSLAFQFAGSHARTVPLTLCIDEVSLTSTPER